MRTNPGGYIPPNDVVGRDAQIRRYWKVLEVRSLVLSAERRMGKTTITRKMEAEVEGALAYYRDLEKVRTPIEFVEAVLEDVQHCLGLQKRVVQGVKDLLASLSRAEVEALGTKIKLPEAAKPQWKKILEVAFKDLHDEQKQRVIFFWDELPLMVDNIRQSSGEKAAMEILDTLRALRQQYPERLRMVYTGSIGLHNVISALKRDGYANDPTNDMQREDVPPLTPKFAKELALKLIQAEKLQTVDDELIAEQIAIAVNGMPFYIQHTVDRLTTLDGLIDVVAVQKQINFFLRDPQDTLHLRYYRERISTYYTETEKSLAFALLDVVAQESKAIGFTEIYNRMVIKPNLSSTGEEAVRDVLTLLQLDHYIERNEEGNYRFRSSFIQQYWRFERGL
jgi:hypothetical protein